MIHAPAARNPSFENTYDNSAERASGSHTVYKSQIPVIEQAIGTAALMLGSVCVSRSCVATVGGVNPVA